MALGVGLESVDHVRELRQFEGEKTRELEGGDTRELQGGDIRELLGTSDQERAIIEWMDGCQSDIHKISSVVISPPLDRLADDSYLHSVADEEHGHVVADHVKVPLLGIELDGETTGVAERLCGCLRIIAIHK